MNPHIPHNQNKCPSAEISAYIDGELSPHGEIELERHFADCSICRTELNLQKNFLFALNASLENEKDFELPKNFTKTIVANAESRVSGLRRPREQFTAVFICTALFLFVLFALGGDAESGLGAFGAFIDKAAALGTFALHFAYNVALGAVVIFRALSSQFVVNSLLTLSLLAFLFVASIFVFSRLVFPASRTREN